MKRFRREDEQAALVDGVFLEDDTMTQITRLFKIVDKDCNGQIDMDDFKLAEGGMTGDQWQKWTEVRPVLTDSHNIRRSMWCRDRLVVRN